MSNITNSLGSLSQTMGEIRELERTIQTALVSNSAAFVDLVGVLVGGEGSKLSDVANSLDGIKDQLVIVNQHIADGDFVTPPMGGPQP